MLLLLEEDPVSRLELVLVISESKEEEDSAMEFHELSVSGAKFIAELTGDS